MTRCKSRTCLSSWWYVLILGASVAVSGCTKKPSNPFDEIPSDKSKLLDDFESYQSQVQFQKVLSQKSLHGAASDERGSFAIAAVDHYSHLGCDGHLEATFVFDRLMSIRFSPSDDECYRNALQRLGITFSRDGDFVYRRQYTRIDSGRDRNGAKYYLWIDTRLEESWNNWVEHHSG